MIEFDQYDLKRQLPPEDFPKLQKLVPEFRKYEDITSIAFYGEANRFEVDLELLMELLPSLPFKIIGKVYESDSKIASEIHSDILMMKTKLQEFGVAINNFSRERDLLNFNLGKNPVVINVQNDKLLSINEILEEKEADYEDIQKHLDDGWMIITTFVERTMSENGDAKPSYVLGRHNSKLRAKEL